MQMQNGVITSRVCHCNLRLQNRGWKTVGHIYYVTEDRAEDTLSVATLGPLQPFECEEQRSETILITVQPNTKEPIKNRPSYGAS